MPETQPELYCDSLETVINPTNIGLRKACCVTGSVHYSHDNTRVPWRDIQNVNLEACVQRASGCPRHAHTTNNGIWCFEISCQQNKQAGSKCTCKKKGKKICSITRFKKNSLWEKQVVMLKESSMEIWRFLLLQNRAPMHNPEYKVISLAFQHWGGQLYTEDPA